MRLETPPFDVAPVDFPLAGASACVLPTLAAMPVRPVGVVAPGLDPTTARRIPVDGAQEARLGVAGSGVAEHRSLNLQGLCVTGSGLDEDAADYDPAADTAEVDDDRDDNPTIADSRGRAGRRRARCRSGGTSCRTLRCSGSHGRADCRGRGRDREGAESSCQPRSDTAAAQGDFAWHRGLAHPALLHSATEHCGFVTKVNSRRS